jgi:thiosulfate/3-mercaptopyruvate sulfurtransferase
MSALVLPKPLVDAEWVARNLHHPDLVIVDCRFSLGNTQRGRQQYNCGHLPGAFYLDLNQDLSGSVGRHGGRHPLPVLTDFVAKLEQIGVRSHPKTAVVAYDDSRGAFASRLWWLLRYLDHDSVAVLQGGFSEWQDKGLSITVNTPTPVAEGGNFMARPQEDWILTYPQVKEWQQHGDEVLVDARSPERFRGEVEPIDPVAGSIPGAVNYFWQRVVDEKGYFLAPSALKHYWSSLDTASDVVMYCGSGVTACVNLLSREVAGYTPAKLYVGGWSDWCSYLH